MSNILEIIPEMLSQVLFCTLLVETAPLIRGEMGIPCTDKQITSKRV